MEKTTGTSSVNGLIDDNVKLLEDILERNYYKDFKSDKPTKQIEFIINRKNSKSQCYGCFNNEETIMYPDIDFSVNNYETIFNNLENLLNYYDLKKFKANIELSGLDWINEIQHLNILELIYNKLKMMVNRPEKIIINTDCKFILEQDLYKKILDLKQEFNNLKINLFFNIYADGLYCDVNNNDEIFYNKLINFINNELNSNEFVIKAYLKSTNINNWIENYRWWILNLNNLALTNIKLLDQKNTTWSKEAIANYLIFMQMQINYFKDILHEEDFIKLIFDKMPEIKFCNINLKETKYTDNTINNNNCNLFKNLTIDLTTMNIVPCAKINYEDFSWGQFYIDENILKLKAKNISVSMYSAHLKQTCLPHCETCHHLDFCEGHCLGESYNKCFNPLVPIREFCNLSIARTNFLIYYYSVLNLINKKTLVKLKCNENYISMLMNLLDQIKEK